MDLDKLNIDDLGLEFFDYQEILQASNQKEENNQQEDNKQPELSTGQKSNFLQFGPSKNQLKSFDNWDGCDGKFFFPYNQQAKIGKISDFVSAAILKAKEQERDAEKLIAQQAYQKEKKQNNPQKQKQSKEEAKQIVEEEQIIELDEDDGFKTIQEGRGKPQTKKNGQTWQKNAQQSVNYKKQAQAGDIDYVNKVKYAKAKSKKDIAKQNFWMGNINKQLRCNLRDYSVDVKPEWRLIKEYTKQQFDRLSPYKPNFIKDEKLCGDVYAYDQQWEKASGKKPKPLKNFEGQTFEESLFDDQVMIQLIENDAADIFTTDVVAAILMASTKSNYSWDLEIKMYEGKIFIDKRQEDQETNILNYQTVCETAIEYQPIDDQSINGIKSLMHEAQKINNSWLNQCQNQNVASQVQLEDENPFIETENQVATRIGYIYKIWEFQDDEDEEEEGKEKQKKDNTKKPKKICIRCSVHSHTGITKENGEQQFQNVYAFNEHNLNRTNWRINIDNSVITCLNKEISDNSFKVSRWVVQALLADVDLMKFAFVSRREMNDNKKHVVLATHTVQTQSWAKQMNISMDRLWPILKFLVNQIEEASAEGKVDEETNEHEYIIIKDFNTMALRLYKKEDLLDQDQQEDYAQ